jgi:hypothetical protein
MPIKPVKMITAWSYSRYNDHSGRDGCPARTKYKHIDKVPETGPKSPALVRGEVIHKLAEDFLRGKIKKLPKELSLFPKEFAELRKMKAVPEGKWGMTVVWEPVDFFDWANAWVRVVLDAHYKPEPAVAKVIDFKTGKIYGDNQDQLELYALAGFAHYPDVDSISTELWYLDQGEIKDRQYNRKDVAKLQRKWRKNVIPILTDRKFLPRPGDYCGRCPYSQRKNGPCKY